MPRYLITQSLISSWAYMFDCREGHEEKAEQEFMRTLRREKGEQTEAARNGVLFENDVYTLAEGFPIKCSNAWRKGANQIADIIRGAQTQVKAMRPLELNGMDFLVYGILDALKAGVIYDVKYRSRRFDCSETSPGVYGKYLHSPQHPIYFYITPGAYEFQYLVSDGEDLYIEKYCREQTRCAEEVIGEFIHSITETGLLSLYKEKWQAL